MRRLGAVLVLRAAIWLWDQFIEYAENNAMRMYAVEEKREFELTLARIKSMSKAS